MLFSQRTALWDTNNAVRLTRVINCWDYERLLQIFPLVSLGFPSTLCLSLSPPGCGDGGKAPPKFGLSFQLNSFSGWKTPLWSKVDVVMNHTERGMQGRLSEDKRTKVRQERLLKMLTFQRFLIVVSKLPCLFKGVIKSQFPFCDEMRGNTTATSAGRLML